MRMVKASDINMINKWLLQRKMPTIAAWQLPEIGFIVEDVACGFLIMMSNGYCVLDFFISNPDAIAKHRSEAFDDIVEKLEAYAKSCQVHKILAYTKVFRIKKIAERLAYKSIGEFTCFEKELK